jgi:DNA-directed RNA polymerase subunit K/omega
MGAFEFAVLAGLRAAQLQSGCLPRVEGGRAVTSIAQMEVAQGKVVRFVPEPAELPAAE